MDDFNDEEKLLETWNVLVRCLWSATEEDFGLVQTQVERLRLAAERRGINLVVK